MPQHCHRPSKLRSFLNRIFNPFRLNDSALYKQYLALRHPDHLRQKRLEQAFYRDWIVANGAGTVFDIGANCGDKAVQFLASAERVVCIEPDPAAALLLRERFSSRANLVVVNKGVGSRPGKAPFYRLSPANPLNTFSHKWSAAQAASDHGIESTAVDSIEVITLDQLIEEFGQPAYVKIDVEGFELEVLEGLHKPLMAVSFECNLGQFRGETIRCIELLNTLGPGKFNYCLSEPPSSFAKEGFLNKSRSTAAQWMSAVFDVKMCLNGPL